MGRNGWTFPPPSFMLPNKHHERPPFERSEGDFSTDNTLVTHTHMLPGHADDAVHQQHINDVIATFPSHLNHANVPAPFFLPKKTRPPRYACPHCNARISDDF